MTNESVLIGCYYLHTNGDLIYKPMIPEDIWETPFAKKVWLVSDIGRSPEDFMLFLSDALSLKANPHRVEELYLFNQLHKYIPDELHKVAIERLAEEKAKWNTHLHAH